MYDGATVELDGTGSTDPNATPLTYQWTLISTPPGDSAPINNPTLPVSELHIEQEGTYVVQLVVNDGASNSDPAIVTISTTSPPPTANAGQNQLASVGTAVQLDGSGSIDPDGNPITYAWSILSAPKGSAANISDTTAPLPSFTPDLSGSYVAQLIVTDKNASGTPSTVTISTTYVPPIANAGNNQSDPVGTTVVLDASLSTDPNGLPLTYSWALISKPDGSNATLSDQTAVHPTFVIDISGIYVAQLVVKDALGASLPVTVGIFTGLPLPIANAGPNQTVQIGQQSGVILNGSGSTVYGGAVVYSWSILYQPQGSNTSTLSSTYISNPSFALYNKGTYVVQLITGDGVYRGLPSTVVINVLDTIYLNDLGVGNESYAGQLVEIHSAPTPGEVVTITSSDPTHFLLAASPTQIGAATITLPLTGLPPFVTVEGQNFSGTAPITATYTASAPGYTSVTAKLTLVPTGWYLYPPGPQTTTLFGSPLLLGPVFSTLDPATLAGPGPPYYIGYSPDIPLGPQAGPVSIPITSSNPAVGTLSGGVFRPLALGTTVLTMTEPPGYSTPSNESLQTTVTVNQDQIGVGGALGVGNNSMIIWSVFFPDHHPPTKPSPLPAAIPLTFCCRPVRQLSVLRAL